MLNISYLKSPPPLFSFTLLPSIPGLVYRFHFSIYINVCTVFVPYSSSYKLSPLLPLPTTTNTPGRTCSPILWFCKRKKMTFCLPKETVSSLVIFVYIYIYIYVYICICILYIYIPVLVNLFYTMAIIQRLRGWSWRHTSVIHLTATQ
jgi:hypothetical protein